MPDISQSLQGRDLGHLVIVAEGWGIKLDAPDTRTALQHLSIFLLDPQIVTKRIAELPAEARQALDDLIRSSGRLPWSLFTRRYGEVRVMGAGKRDREQPQRSPTSPAELLWYLALVARSFFDTSAGVQEFAYIPDDLLPLLPQPASQDAVPMGRPATAPEAAHLIPATDGILDHACSLLAALRIALPEGEIQALFTLSHPPSPTSLSYARYPLSQIPLKSLLAAADLLDTHGLPQPERTRHFLEAPRAKALVMLAQAWIASDRVNDLRLIPHLSAEGEWQNDPLQTRRAVLNFLSGIPKETWWSVPAFVDTIHQQNPDFQRPQGDYDSWFIRDRRTGAYLRGFAHWDEVDGELLYWMISGPLHWLGILDLACPSEGEPPSAFRFSKWATALLAGEPPLGLPDEEGVIQAVSDARIHVPRLAPRSIRYQIARFCLLLKEKEGVYQYRITPASLERARQQGLAVAQLVALLKRHAHPVPPSLVKTLGRWEKHGSEIHLEQAVVLRVASPDIMKTLRTSRAARFLGDLLGPTAATLKPDAVDRVLAILAESGFLGDTQIENKD